ncbi:MAG: tRNA (adenosine(37)-N6)-dimethylallyltransferase MiaA [bacterium]|nr:tRNA (adenosine(37)-N6)-dimethylallyltransferase MiaA [Candidatus Sumerlaeota bacterium]
MIIVITGPTGIGKTAVAVELAKELDTEIISADSMQVYRHLSIGTAKPSPDELCGVTCHLIDYKDPACQYNLGDFIHDAEVEIERIKSKGRTPIVCGGAMMYIQGLLRGVFMEESRDSSIREKLRHEADAGRLAELYAELMRLDPAATHILPNDRQRILRALEVIRVTNRPLTSLQTQKNDKTPRHEARIFVLMRSRDELYIRINARVDAMMTAGLLDEVSQYMSMGYSRDNPAIRALGYTQLFSCHEGAMPLEHALEEMKKRTRNYAKRQLTWFRSMRDAEFIDCGGDDARQLCELIKKKLAQPRQQLL